LLHAGRNLIARTLALGLAATLAVAGCGAPPQSQAAPAVAAGLEAAARAKGLDGWRDEVIYFILTDRFSNGDRSNDFNVKPRDPHAYHGGDFQGIINKLGYIKSLGATTIWITPINDNRDDSLVDKYWGFHGYWTKNWETVDEHLGSEAKFKELVNAAHARGIKVMLDMVVNHMGYDAPWTKDAAKRDWFHHNGDIKNWDDPWQVENGDISGLPDMNTENPAVLKYMEDMWVSWIKRTNVDAFRMDTVKHVPLKFWSQFNRNVHARAPKDFLLLGEHLNGDPNALAPYTREGDFDSLFDFPMYFTLNDVFARGQSMRKLAQRLEADGAYKDATMLSPFLDNHDMPRFMSIAGGDERKLRLALAFIMTMRGIPCMYQGTETAQDGAGEPENRKDMNFGANPGMTAYATKLMHLRHQLEPLRRGRQLEMWQDDQIYGFTRLSGKDEAMAFFNNDSHPQMRDIPLRAESNLPDGTVLTDRLGGGTVEVVNHRIRVALGPKQARVFSAGNAAQSIRKPTKRD
jgi:glycosidase